ncbi:hypothetical protein AN958_08978 [Leucoagaricus sp. SymC.cos]|nr:hypothetical protein AN958_08978 [Leucoagaricus sp. SymC.cos]
MSLYNAKWSTDDTPDPSGKVAIVTGHCYFTQLLLPQLIAASSSRVNVSSYGHVLVDGINWNTVRLRDGPLRQTMKPVDLYNQVKCARLPPFQIVLGLLIVRLC